MAVMAMHHFIDEHLHKLLDVSFRQRLEDENPATREECRNDFEARILRGGADEGQFAGLHIRQEEVLLGLVEAVYLVEEKELGALLHERIRFRNYLFYIVFTRRDSRKFIEPSIESFRIYLGKCSFSCPRWAPKIKREKMFIFDRLIQRFSFAN